MFLFVNCWYVICTLHRFSTACVTRVSPVCFVLFVCEDYVV